MSGHNKWSQIKHKKAKTDAQKGKVFSKVVREIMIAIKLGGGSDPASNHRLRLALQKAKEANMPNDNIKRAIQKGEGAGDSSQFEDVVYEGYGPNGVAVMVDAVTDNRNRTVSNIRLIFGKYGGNLGSTGSVSYLFDRKGIFVFAPGASESAIMDVALANDAEDVDLKEDGSIEVVVSPDAYLSTVDAFTSAKLSYEYGAIDQIPTTTVSLSGEDAIVIEKLLEMLEEDDDVQAVYSNFTS